jgi:hypothetical protein
MSRVQQRIAQCRHVGTASRNRFRTCTAHQALCPKEGTCIHRSSPRRGQSRCFPTCWPPESAARIAAGPLASPRLAARERERMPATDRCCTSGSNARSIFFLRTEPSAHGHRPSGQRATAAVSTRAVSDVYKNQNPEKGRAFQGFERNLKRGEKHRLKETTPCEGARAEQGTAWSGGSVA